MRHFPAMLTAVLLAASAQAAAPRLSVEQLLASFQQGPASAEQRYAEGYLAGVADASQGRLWCDTGRVKTVELDGIVLAELKKLPAAGRQRQAAPLVIAILAQRFPCFHPAVGG